MKDIETGMIHGRFQPFHHGHFFYLRKALEYSKKLIIGITNPDPSFTTKVESDSHRHLSDANPFSYYLRMKMIQNSILCDDKLRMRYSDVVITPFPINKPEYWKYYIPMGDVVQLMTILDPWDEEKQNLFQKHGFEVIVLGDNRIVSGAEIRQDIYNKKSWVHKVPRGTMEILEQWLRKGAHLCPINDDRANTENCNEGD